MTKRIREYWNVGFYGLVLVVFFLYFAVEPLNLRPERYLSFTILLGLIFFLCLFRSRLLSREFLFLGVLSIVMIPIFFTGFPGNALEYGVVVFTAGILGLSQTVVSPDQREQTSFFLLIGLIFVVFIHVVPSLIEQIIYFGSWGWKRVPTGGFRNPNVLARVVGISGFGILLFRPKCRKLQIGSLLIGSVLLLSLFWIGSRGALLGLFLASGWFLWKKLPLKVRWIEGVMVLLLLLIAVGFLVGSFQQITNHQRIQLIGESWDMFRDHPITGVGGWNFGLEYPSVSKDARWQRHPHSLPLWIGTGFGMIGLAGTFYLGYFFWIRLRDDRFLPLLIFIFGHEMVDTMLWIPGVLWLTVIALSPLFTGERIHPNNNQNSRKAVTATSLTLVAIFTVTAGFLFMQNRAYRTGLTFAHQNQWDKARAEWKSVGSSWGRVHYALALVKSKEFPKSELPLEKAHTLNRLDPYYPWLLFRHHEKSSDTKQAEAYRNLAEKRDPHGMMTGDSTPKEPDFPDDFSQLGRSQVRPKKIYAHPRQAGWYIPFVDRSLREGRCLRGVKQIRLLSRYPIQTSFARIQLERRRLTCYRMLGMTEEAKVSKKRLFQWNQTGERSRRRSFHRLFYRRPGIDHVFFQ